jgi:hypothetical protein
LTDLSEERLITAQRSKVPEEHSKRHWIVDRQDEVVEDDLTGVRTIENAQLHLDHR